MKYRTFLVIAGPPRVEGNVIPIRSARVRRVPLVPIVPTLVAASAPPRDTSWRDLVRRLVKSLAKR